MLGSGGDKMGEATRRDDRVAAV
jgi:hypothetical protein